MNHPARHHPFAGLDTVGASLLLLLAAGTYFGAWQPGVTAAQQCEHTLATVARSERAIAGRQQQLQTIAEETAIFHARVADQINRAPRATEVNKLVSALVTAAQAAELTVDRVLPERLRHDGGYYTCDVELQARGTPQALITLLDALARLHPYHAVQGYEVRRPRDANVPCNLTLELRLYLLASEDTAATESGATP